MPAPVVVAGAAVALAVGGPGFDPVRVAWAEAEYRGLRGTWVAVAGVRDGKAIPADELTRIRLTFRGPQDGHFYTFTDLRPLIDDPTATAAHFLVQPWRSPAGFEVWRQYGARTSWYPGRYERTGDTLRLCVDLRFSPDGPPTRTRPPGFAAPAGSGLTSLTLTRVR